MNRSAAAALAAALCLLTAACGSSSEDKASAKSTEAADAGVKTGYPVTLDNCGQKETFERAPVASS